MSESKSTLRKYLRFLLLAVIVAGAVYLVSRNFHKFWYILMAVVGFGTVVIVHEFGHFFVAKLSKIKVEAFSIFMPPTFVGVRKTEDGLRFRILPTFFPKEDDESGEGRLSFTIGKKGKAGETEYRIGLVPFGGYVSMLGQEDVGTTKVSDDPRSYANKPVSTRMAVIAAGVFLNIVSAVIALVIVFLIGINRPPPVVGWVLPNSPAARAGLKAGDEVIEIAGKRDNLEFMDIQMAAALAGRDEAIKLRVRHEDGTEEDFAIVAEQLPGMRLKGFGIGLPLSLTVADVSDANALLEKTGLHPGDHIKGVDGRDVQAHWELEEIIRKAFAPAVTLSAKRIDPVSKKSALIESQLRLDLSPAERQVKSESDLSHIYSMVPRLRIKGVEKAPSLREGDIVLAVGDVENPTYGELREVTEEYEEKELPIKVLRSDANGVEEALVVTVEPERSKDGKRVVIGIIPVLDTGHAVVAKTIAAEDGPEKLAIPRGAVITAVDGVGVSDFYDVIREIRRNSGRRIRMDYRVSSEIAGDVILNVERIEDFVAVKSDFAEFVPFKHLQRLYKAGGLISAVSMGYRKTVVFIAQAYVTLKRLVGGLVSPKEFMGPVGIVTLGYRVLTERPLIYYVYILGLISAFIGVLNSVPVLPFDGGHIAFLLVEKVKGSPVNERVQGAINYAGWVVVGAFAVYVTFNDIVRSFFS